MSSSCCRCCRSSGSDEACATRAAARLHVRGCSKGQLGLARQGLDAGGGVAGKCNGSGPSALAGLLGIQQLKVGPTGALVAVLLACCQLAIKLHLLRPPRGHPHGRGGGGGRCRLQAPGWQQQQQQLPGAC